MTIKEAYQTVRNELEKFGEGLTEKQEVIILTKTDVSEKKAIAKARKDLSKFNKDILEVSILDDDSMKELSKQLMKRLQKAVLIRIR